jgi:two-component system, LytTR family, sensor kinase
VHFITKYRTFQFLGWGFFAGLNIYIAIILNELSLPIFWMDILLAFTGFACTHMYRRVIITYKWNYFSTEKLLVHVFFGIGILTILFNAIYFLFIETCQYFNLLPSSIGIHFGTLISVFMLFALWSVFYFAWHYIERNRSMLIERLQLESNMKDLEIKTIKANLQPHFIFNSLNSIRALIDENPILAREAITKISRILRQSISQQEAVDTLENELQLVDDYLDLEKIRFEERLVFSKQIDARTSTIPIPTMMLQTIVENAIKHGISKLEQGGNIHLLTALNDDVLHIQVLNSGSLKQINTAETSLGFGLSSTKQRLHLLYKHDATFNIEEKDNQVIVDIYIKQNTP